MGAPANAYVIRDGIVTVDSVDYANQCRIAKLVPDVPIQTYRTLVPDGAVQDIDTPVYTFELTGLQINASGGLSHALRALEPGTEVVVVLAPRDKPGDDKATFTIKAVPPTFGGEQGSFATQEMVFPVVGQPVFSAIS
jgi:hypothetical protein